MSKLLQFKKKSFKCYKCKGLKKTWILVTEAEYKTLLQMNSSKEVNV